MHHAVGVILLLVAGPAQSALTRCYVGKWKGKNRRGATMKKILITALAFMLSAVAVADVEVKEGKDGWLWFKYDGIGMYSPIYIADTHTKLCFIQEGSRGRRPTPLSCEALTKRDEWKILAGKFDRPTSVTDTEIHEGDNGWLWASYDAYGSFKFVYTVDPIIQLCFLGDFAANTIDIPCEDLAKREEWKPYLTWISSE
jgi:hypothetical protein